MKTRRSPRNQDILWRMLGGKTETPKPIAPIYTDAEIDAMYWMPKASHSLMKRDAAKRRKESQ